MRKILLGLLSLISSSLISQEFPIKIDTSRNTVIAVSGLSLRSAPSLDADRLSIIPYRKQVRILEQKSYGLDTVTTYHGTYRHNGQQWSYPVKGHWRKVAYGDEQGYVMDAYLYHGHILKHQSQNLRGIMYPQQDCDYLHLSDYQYFGLYQKENQQEFEWRKVQAVSFYEPEGFDGTFIPHMHTLFQPLKNLKFVIRDTTDWTGRKVRGNFYYDDSLAFFKVDQATQTLIPQVKQFEPFGIQLAPDISFNNWPEVPLNIQKDSITQRLNIDQHKYLKPWSMRWYGDLDGDGKTDYIIRYGDHFANDILYLSTHAESGKLVQPVENLCGIQ